MIAKLIMLHVAYNCVFSQSVLINFACFNCSRSYTSKYMYNTVNIHVDVSVFMTSAKLQSTQIPQHEGTLQAPQLLVDVDCIELHSYYRSTY